ncbi:MAG: hypothetical protein JWP30_337 [Homoserinimonas sp.]|jgi:hypothetical protein|nr:hypothetical protein [Homoserinimonas sp.]
MKAMLGGGKALQKHPRDVCHRAASMEAITGINLKGPTAANRRNGESPAVAGLSLVRPEGFEPPAY